MGSGVGDSGSVLSLTDAARLIYIGFAMNSDAVLEVRDAGSFSTI